MEASGEERQQPVAAAATADDDETNNVVPAGDEPTKTTTTATTSPGDGKRDELSGSQHEMTTITISATITSQQPDQQQMNDQLEKQETVTTNDEEKRELLPQAANQEKEDKLDDDGFVIIDPENSFRLEKHKASFFAQMEKYLNDQVALCNYYKQLYEDQKNDTMANLFATHLLNTNRDLDLLRIAARNNENLPKYKIETVTFNGVPVNVDVKERELQLVVRTSKLSVSAENAQIYVIGEFSFGLSDEPVSTTISRWFHHVKVEPRNLVCCSVDASRQLDIIYSTDGKPFMNPSSEWLEFDRPLLFTVNKGKSRTHKRKFKPLKLTFFERTNLLKSDKKLGTIQLKVDAINDEARIKTKQVIMNGRKDTGAYADIQIKVWKPLVENTIRAHEEKLLILS